MEGFPGNIYWVNEKGIILGCNKNQAISLGFSNESDVSGKKMYEVIPKKEAHSLVHTHREIMKTGKTIFLEETLTFQGKKRYFLSQKSPFRDDAGKTVGIIGFSVDVTDQNIHSEDYEKTVFSYLSHDLRTPLQCILLLTESLKNELQDPKHRELITYIHTASEQLFKHCSSLYERCKKQKDKTPVLVNQPLDLEKICNDLIDMHRPCFLSKKIELIGEFCAPMPLLLGDNERIKLMILHLLSNAIKFTEKGAVSIQIKIFPKSNEEVTAKIIVRDTGIGIPENIKSTIFEDFVTEKPIYITQHQGMGLGLSTVKELVNELKAEIKVESQKDKGSTFTVYIPLKVSLESNC